MNGRFMKYFLLLLVFEGFIHAVSSTRLQAKKSRLNSHVNELLHKKLNHRSRKQDDYNPVPLTDKYDIFEDEDGNEGVIDTSQIVDEYVTHEKLDGESNVPLNDIISTETKQLYEIEPMKSSSNDKKFKYKQSRSLQVGDTMTPEELLAVTRRLLQKVTKRGKGIVSESQNEYDLADKLFERYFMTGRRIVDIKESDIDGLDALQALSLDGDIVNYLRSSSESFTEGPNLVFHGFKVDPGVNLYGYEPDDYPNKCHYKVLRKWVEEKSTLQTLKNKRRRQANLKKTLGKNRKLVVNPNRRKLIRMIQQRKNYPHSATMKDDKSIIKSTKAVNEETLQRTINRATVTNTSAKNKSDNAVICRWKYRCAKEFQLHTCRLHPICSNQTEYKLAFITEEQDKDLRKFREHVGISLLDEKVEKIIESHFIRIMPQSKRSKKIEDLVQYFNKIVVANGLYTTPMPGKENPANERHPLNAEANSVMPNPLMNVEERVATTPDSLADDDLEARRILGLIPSKKKYKYFTTETPRNAPKT